MSINNCGADQLDFDLIRKEMREMENSLYKDIQDISNTVAECSAYLKTNLKSTVEGYMQRLEKAGKLGDILTDAVISDINVLNAKTKSMISVLEYGAHPNAMCDCTAAIQKAIDAANEKGAAVYFPKGVYLISNTIKLNGCSLYGEVGNIYSEDGVIIECATKDFVAISQGSTASGHIMFDIKNLMVKNAQTGFEIIYAINSKYENLYAIDCETGYKIGDPAAVGCMFCKFEQLYTRGCNYGVVINSKEYCNNNQFINGYIQGNTTALSLKVTGGYGAVNNTFQNVEFRSELGRGVELTSAANTIFNECYFETGATAIYNAKGSTITLNNCVYASYKKSNTFGEFCCGVRFQGGGSLTINGGTIYLTAEYTDTTFFLPTDNLAVYANVLIIKDITRINTDLAPGFAFYIDYGVGMGLKKYQAPKMEQTALTGTVTLAGGAMNVEVPFEFAKPFASIPPVFLVAIRGATGAYVSYVFSERLASGGKLMVNNSGTQDVSVSFMIYAKEV